MSDEEKPMLSDGDSPAPAMRAAKPTLKPFIVLLIAWFVVMGALLALSVFGGGCQSAPEQCFAAAWNAPQNLSVSWANLDNGFSVRAIAQAPPAFLLPLLAHNDLLGMARLFAVSNGTGSWAAGVATPFADATNSSVQTFNNTQSSVWLGAGAVSGQFARIGFQCDCHAANRSVLGASKISLAANAVGAVYADADGAALDVVNASDISALLSLAGSTQARGQPTAVLRTPGQDFLFVDVFTQTNEQGNAVAIASSIALGSLDAPPLNMARNNGSMLQWSIHPTAALLVDTTVYLYIEAPGPIATLAKTDLASLKKGMPTLSYFQSISLSNASEAVWVQNISAAGQLNSGCSMRALMGKRALCVAPSETQPMTNQTRNSIQYFELDKPWTLASDVVTIATSAWGEQFVGASFHAESATATTVWISTVSATTGFDEAIPHTLNLPSFSVLEKRKN